MDGCCTLASVHVLEAKEDELGDFFIFLLSRVGLGVYRGILLSKLVATLV